MVGCGSASHHACKQYPVMTSMEEQTTLEAGLRRKQTKRERFRGALRRGADKLKKNKDDDEEGGNDKFTLNEDVKDFLSLKEDRSRSSFDDRLQVPGDVRPTSHEGFLLQRPASADQLPVHPSPSRPPPVPRIDVSRSPRFPDAREFGEPGPQQGLLQRPREGGSGSQPGRRSRRRREGLKVHFAETPPVIIGEGGDEAEVPASLVVQARQAASAEVAPRQPANSVMPHLIPRKQVANARQVSSPASQQNSELDIALAAPTQLDDGKEIATKQPELMEQRLQPLKTQRRMRAEEGKTLRESYYEQSPRAPPLENPFDD